MKNLLCLLLLIAALTQTAAQINTEPEDREAIQDSLQNFSAREPANDSLKVHRPVITDYVYWRENDFAPTVIDTTLTIQRFYLQNYTQNDVFGKMYFSNYGQTFNPLEFQPNKFRLHLLPTGKSFNYLFPEDIKYYDVKTPMTELLFENGLKEGQYLSTTFAHNLSARLNYSVRYRGLRSVGRYKNNLAANNAFVSTLNYHSQNERFKLWTHFASQNIDNQENAGISDLNEFVYDDSLRTTNRQNIAVNLENAYTEFDSRRIHIGGSYGFFGLAKSDSTQLNAPLVFKNIFTYEKQKYFYREKQNETYYQSSVFDDVSRRNLKSFETLQNTSTLQFKWGEKLLVESGLRYENVKLYEEKLLEQGLINIPKQLDDHLLGVVGRFYFDWNDKLKLLADAEYKSGELFKNQYHVNAELDIQPLGGYHLIAGAMMESAFPSMNLYYHQSFYKDFNYYNYSFDNTNTRQLYARLDFEKFNTRFSGHLYNIENYVYVDTDFRPKQLKAGISIFQIRGDILIPYRKFNLSATLQYQKVTQNSDFLPLPDLIGRASIYWQDKMFDGKAEVQIGLNGNYFTEFQSREFFPVINEFMLQRTNPDFGIQKIGGFPVLDFFLNMKVQRMIIFLRADHFNALWGENNYYSAPFTPFRDFKIQLGLKWYLFT